MKTSLPKSFPLPGLNIALKQKALQLPGTYLFYSAEYAVDGNHDNNVDMGEGCAHTSQSETAASWTVILDQAYNITGISLLNRKSEGASFLNENLKSASMLENKMCHRNRLNL